MNKRPTKKKNNALDRLIKWCNFCNTRRGTKGCRHFVTYKRSGKG